MEKYTKQDFIKALGCMAKHMDQQREYLIELDSKIGDSDLGITMTKGFAAACQKVGSPDDGDMGTLFKKAGFAILNDAPSTMGTLMATAFIGAAKVLAGKEMMDAGDVATMFEAIAEACQSRGKSQEGDKTMLDVLFPVARAVAASQSPDVAERFKIASEEAAVSVQRTKDMVSQHGKAAVFREQTKGLVDPGAAATALMIEGFYDSCTS